MSFIKNEPTPLTLLQIKLALMKYFKYDKNCIAVINEFRHNVYDGCANIEDLVVLTETDIIAIGIKITKNDFITDFNKAKYRTPKSSLFYNKFYFCIPYDLKEFVCKYLEENNYIDYGILLIDDNEDIINYYNAQDLNEPKIIQNFEYKNLIFDFFKKMTNDNILLRENI